MWDMRDRVIGFAALAALCASAACSSERTSSRQSALEAFCQAEVIGTGLVDVETDYLPSVVNCENGAASFAALQVQAVAARSYLYYRLEGTGDIGDGTGDQVYSCGREPTEMARLAVESTSGEVLRYADTQVAAFYVAGALQTPPECRGGTDDPTSTERFVTYNEGLSGADIEQTTLGFVHPDNFANRGCMSQNGSDCLSDDGRDYRDILRFYYGADIEIARAEGPCVVGGDPDAGPGDADAGAGAGADAGIDTSQPGGCRASGSSSSGAAGLVAVLLACALLRRRRIHPA